MLRYCRDNVAMLSRQRCDIVPTTKKTLFLRKGTSTEILRQNQHQRPKPRGGKTAAWTQLRCRRMWPVLISSCQAGASLALVPAHDSKHYSDIAGRNPEEWFAPAREICGIAFPGQPWCGLPDQAPGTLRCCASVHAFPNGLVLIAMFHCRFTSVCTGASGLTLLPSRQLHLPTKVADCTGTGPGRLQRKP